MTTSEISHAPAADQRRSRRASRSLRGFLRWEWFLVVLIVLVVLVNSHLSPYFLNVAQPVPHLLGLHGNGPDDAADGLHHHHRQRRPVGRLDPGHDGLVHGLAVHMHGVNIWVAAAAALLLGALAGLLNGYLITRLKVPALVITLGTYAFYRGMAYVLLGDQAARGYPEAFTYLGQGRSPGTPVPFSVLLFAVLALIFGLVLHKTAFGRYLYAIGNNQDAVIYSGVPVARVKIIIFTLSGLMAALAGLVLAARFGSTRPDIGTGPGTGRHHRHRAGRRGYQRRERHHDRRDPVAAAGRA